MTPTGAHVRIAMRERGLIRTFRGDLQGAAGGSDAVHVSGLSVRSPSGILSILGHVLAHHESAVNAGITVPI